METNMATTNAAISVRILAAIAHGRTATAAIDHVLGAGTSAALIDDVYDALRSRRG